MNGDKLEQNLEQIFSLTDRLSNWFIGLLDSISVPEYMIKYINLIFLITILAILLLSLHYITKIILQLILKRFAKRIKGNFLSHLNQRKFPHFLAMIIPFIIVRGSIPIMFIHFPQLMNMMNKLADIFLVFYMIWLTMSVINASVDTFRLKSGFRDKPLDSYLQVIKIVLYTIGFIILFSILTGQNPTAIIAGLGAASAVLMLIFKDLILGLVASIQVTTNDMVRIGDWITMPKYGADGDVIQITLTTVKVRNFDKTITTLPPYALVSDSFQNWRGMSETGGRRLKRSIFIKQGTIRFISDEELAELKKIELISDYITDRSREIYEYNSDRGVDKSLLINGRNLTNIGLYRQYILTYLQNHPDIHKELLLIVRQLQPTEKGLPIELYFFTNTTNWINYEGIVADVFDHVCAASTFFDLSLFEDLSNH